MTNADTTYRVLVGNIGQVEETGDISKARRTYNEYVSQSKQGYGRASGEAVSLWVQFDGCEEIVDEFNPGEEQMSKNHTDACDFYNQISPICICPTEPNMPTQSKSQHTPSKGQHTPGPWATTKDGIRFSGSAGITFEPWGNTEPISDADKNLIAQAPRMLELLQRIANTQMGHSCAIMEGSELGNYGIGFIGEARQILKEVEGS